MPFVKLDCGLLDSTLWMDTVARDVFITALLMAEPIEQKEKTNQLNVRDLNETGFVVPCGWYGFVPAAGSGIIHRSGVPVEQGLKALEILGSEDPESRTPDFGGRRMVRVDGGYLILNFIKYREKDATSADRSKRWRERQRLKEQKESNQTTRVSETPQRVIRHQAEAEAEAEAEVEVKREEKKSSNLTDEEWLLWIKETYHWVDIEIEMRKMKAWLETRKSRRFTKRFAIKWLNNCERPIEHLVKEKEPTKSTGCFAEDYGLPTQAQIK